MKVKINIEEFEALVNVKKSEYKIEKGSHADTVLPATFYIVHPRTGESKQYKKVYE